MSVRIPCAPPFSPCMAVARGHYVKKLSCQAVCFVNSIKKYFCLIILNKNARASMKKVVILNCYIFYGANLPLFQKIGCHPGRERPKKREIPMQHFFLKYFIYLIIFIL